MAYEFNHTIKFTGRPVNTPDGKPIRYTVTVKAENEEKAILKLYEKYEHVSIKKVTVKSSDAKKAFKERMINRQEKALELLLTLCEAQPMPSDELRAKLRRLELKANRAAVAYSNGEISTDDWSNKISVDFEKKVQKLFNNKLQGFFVNGDCRGYTLKIKDSLFKPNAIYEKANLQTDWGGYGILGYNFN